MAGQSIPRVLIAEDEVLTALQVEDIVNGMGWIAVGPAREIPELLALIDRIGCDVALLDVNLHGQRVDAVADRLRAAGVPFALLTGYLTSDIDPDYRGVPLVPKPFTAREVEKFACGDCWPISNRDMH